MTNRTIRNAVLIAALTTCTWSNPGFAVQGPTFGAAGRPPLIEKVITSRGIVHGLYDIDPATLREQTFKNMDRAIGLDALYSDEFFRQLTVYTERNAQDDWGTTVSELLHLVGIMGDARAAPALINLLDADSSYAFEAFYLLAELAPNDPAIDERIARGVERVLEGPPYRDIASGMLHHQRADLAIENARRLHDFAVSELERIGVPTGENREERRSLYFLRDGAKTVMIIAEEYAWVDTDAPEVVVQSVFDRRESDRIRLHNDSVRTRVYQAMRRRGLVDMFAERAREEIMAEELGSDKIYRLSSILETLRADIDDELRQKIDDSMAERGRRSMERIRREREAAPDSR